MVKTFFMVGSIMEWSTPVERMAKEQDWWKREWSMVSTWLLETGSAHVPWVIDPTFLSQSFLRVDFFYSFAFKWWTTQDAAGGGVEQHISADAHNFCQCTFHTNERVRLAQGLTCVLSCSRKTVIFIPRCHVTPEHCWAHTLFILVHTISSFTELHLTIGTEPNYRCRSLRGESGRMADWTSNTQSGSGAWLLWEEEDLFVYKVLSSGYCSKLNNTDDECLWGRFWMTSQRSHQKT